jgi:hypothetical protein
VNIRTFEPGDETAQAAIYNEAAAALPKFKPATSQEILRRVTAADFDPASRFYAVEGKQPVAYCASSANGRVSIPWCRKGHEALAGPLFDHMLQAMQQRGHKKVFAAYRSDWSNVLAFFQQRDFTVVREMVNFVLDVFDMPTAPARRTSNIKPLQRQDVPAIFALAPHMLRCASAKDLERHLFDNPYFPASAAFVLRSREHTPLGAGVLIHDPTYADPKALDAAMPCFRLGAFGTEGMQTKRIKGMFSFLCRDDAQCAVPAMELMGHAASLLREGDDITSLAGQCPSDAPQLLRFYQMKFQRQGSFPVLQRTLGPT